MREAHIIYSLVKVLPREKIILLYQEVKEKFIKKANITVWLCPCQKKKKIVFFFLLDSYHKAWELPLLVSQLYLIEAFVCNFDKVSAKYFHDHNDFQPGLTDSYTKETTHLACSLGKIAKMAFLYPMLIETGV